MSATNPDLNSGPLRDIKVVELGTAIAGPMCGMLLGDMGAEVIKIESPRKGDDSRHWGQTVQGESPYFIQYNRNKRSVALNIKSDEGRNILMKLMKESDVLIENFRPRTMEKLGLSYEKVSKVNPRLVYCSVSGFGQSGPYSELGGYDAIMQGMSGLMAVTGEEGGPPLRVGAPITDILAALYSAFAVSLAIIARERTGKGQWIDVSLFESGLSAVAQWITISALTGKPVRRFGNRYPLLAPYETFSTKDLPIVVGVGNEETWKRFCTAIQREELTNDSRFKTNANRIAPENRTALSKILQSIFLTKSARHWIDLLWGADIPSGTINSIEDLAKDSHLRSRGAFASVKHRSLGEISIVTSMPKLLDTPGSVRLPPPTLGEHTKEVLRELGFPNGEISALKSKGII